MAAPEIKPSIRVLVPVWGQRYIDMFLDIGLPSMLTPRNLPTLAAEYACEFVFLTKAADKGRISRHVGYQALARVCKTTFTAIDDLLVSGMEGYSLTLCFSRGIHDVGPKMVDTYFIFMNADFVVSDGAYETLLRHIREGRRAIVAPSLRSVSEQTVPILESKRDDSDHTLTISAREMVGLTLKHLHPTAAANIVDGNFAFNSATNQFFWWVDDHTLIARFFLLFMFCIRPERELQDIPGFCDYTFVPEMCPSGNVAILDDSDQCYLMELQGREQELHYLRFGRPAVEDIARHLSEWTTYNHRLYSRRTIVFHSGDRPNSLARSEQIVAAFMDGVFQRMDDEPISVRNHPYWTGALRAAAQRTNPNRTAAEIAQENAESALAKMAKSAVAARRLFLSLAGEPPLVNMLHFDWQDYRAAVPYLRTALADPAAQILYVNGGLINFEALTSTSRERCHRLELEEILSHKRTAAKVAPTRRYNFCFLYIGTRHLADVGEALSCLTDMTTNDARIVVLIRDDSPDASGPPLSRILLRQLAQIRPFGLSVKSMVSSGGSIKRLVRETVIAQATKIYRYGVFRRPGAVAALAVLIPLAAIINIVAKLRGERVLDGRYCSSLLLNVEKTQI